MSKKRVLSQYYGLLIFGIFFIAFGVSFLPILANPLIGCFFIAVGALLIITSTQHLKK